MSSFTKSHIREVLSPLQSGAWDSATALELLNKNILREKLRFPLHEFIAEELFPFLPASKVSTFLNRLTATETLGGYVISAKILQLVNQPQSTFPLAEKYIIEGNQWYVCDIIGERVYGHALLLQPESTLQHLSLLATHEKKWMVRAIGVAGHYAIKKGLSENDTEKLFRLLLQLCASTQLHTKKGIGWAAKTTAKFYPQIIARHQKEIAERAGKWYVTKTKIGLGRANKYARH